VVVKVKRPDIEDIVRLDMTILGWIADLAERLLPELAVYQPRTIVDEFERSLLREMDFINEAATISRFWSRKAFKSCCRCSLEGLTRTRTRNSSSSLTTSTPGRFTCSPSSKRGSRRGLT
jgi:hypothetical protein